MLEPNGSTFTEKKCSNIDSTKAEEAASLACTKRHRHYPYLTTPDTPCWLVVNNIGRDDENEDGLKFGPFFPLEQQQSGRLVLSLTENKNNKDHLLSIANNKKDIRFDGALRLPSQWNLVEWKHDEINKNETTAAISEKSHCQTAQTTQTCFQLSSVWLRNRGGLTIDKRTKKLMISRHTSRWAWFVFSPADDDGNKDHICTSTGTCGKRSSISRTKETNNRICDNSNDGNEKLNPTHEKRAAVTNPIPHYDADVPPLTNEQKRHFRREGYLKLDNVIPHDILAVAQKAVNAAQNITMMNELQKDDAIINLLRASPVITQVQHLMGKGNVCQRSIKTAQLRMIPPARRRPERNPSSSVPSTSWHVDGMLNFRKHSPFSVLVGISLSDWIEPNNGNFCVWPRSHSKILPVLREVVENPKQMDFSEEVLKKLKDRLPSLGDGVQICAAAGDAVIVHHKLAHGAASNFGPNTRQQIYFRLRHKRHAQFVQSGVLLDNLWAEFQGIDPK